MGTLPGQAAALLAASGVSAMLFPRLWDFLADVRSVNSRLNLLSDDTDAFLLHHLMDALQPLRLAGLPETARLVDVGTGGGFPGLPLLMARPGWSGLLVDSVRKKAEAVRDLAARHAPGRGETSWTRAETLAHEPALRGAFDLAFCRALGPFTTVLELTLPFLKTGGALLAHRGHEAPAETAAAEKALSALGGSVVETLPYDLPGLDKKRYIVRVLKTLPTPSAYPRREGVPAKRPL